MGFDPAEKRDPHGRWTEGAMRLISAADLSSGDARRSREVSPEEFRLHWAKGQVKVAALKANASGAMAMEGPRFKQITDDAYTASRDPWGGVTVDAHSGAHVPPDADEYALTMRDPGMDTVSVSPDASREEFDNAMDTARQRYHEILQRPGSHLGVFHDDDLKRIDIDPVLVTPRLEDVEDIGAYTHAVGGAYHFKSGDGFWPPHVKDGTMGKSKKTDLSSYVTPAFSGEFDLSAGEDGKLAFWKQILPKKVIHYTAKDGTRRTLDFNEQYLTDLANNKAVDKVGFLLADVDNRHTMDPERYRGEVAEMQVREDGLYGKIVFPNKEAAKAVLDNPDLGVSARIREGIARSDGSTLSRGIIHVLGTLDPQVSGMSGWQTADLSMSGDVLDLSNETFEEKDMALNKPVLDYTDAEIDAMSDEELDVFLEAAADLIDADLLENLSEDEGVEPEAEVEAREPEMALSNEVRREIDLANARANEALRRAADAEWRQTRDAYMSEGVPAHLLDLAAPVLNRPDEFVVDLSNTDGAGAEVNVGKIIRGLLDATKGMIDLSVETGHGGTFRSGDGEDPDAEALELWENQG